MTYSCDLCLEIQGDPPSGLCLAYTISCSFSGHSLNEPHDAESEYNPEVLYIDPDTKIDDPIPQGIEVLRMRRTHERIIQIPHRYTYHQSAETVKHIDP